MIEKDIKILEYNVKRFKEERLLGSMLYYDEFNVIEHLLAIEHLLQAYKEQEKVIDEMAERIEFFTGSCPYDTYDWKEIDCEKECTDSSKKCWKQYFINKVKDIGGSK